MLHTGKRSSYIPENEGCKTIHTELIKDAGIDPMSPEPVALTMQKMNRVMDQMEEILETMGK